MTTATSSSASRNGAGMPASARSTKVANPTWRAAGRRTPDRLPRRRFGIAAYRRAVPPPIDPAGEPAGFVVLVEPGDRIHFLDWGGAGAPPLLLVHGLAGSSQAWAPIARRATARR